MCCDILPKAINNKRSITADSVSGGPNLVRACIVQGKIVLYIKISGNRKEKGWREMWQ